MVRLSSERITELSSYTDFPNGVTSFGIPMVGGALPISPEYFFVHGTRGSDGFEGTLERPFASIDFAIGQCTASYGSVVVALPGHTETVTAAGGVALDVAGVQIIGMGTGSLRPTINFTTAVGASVLVTAANCTIQNVLFTGGIDALTNPIHVQAADFSLIGCEYRDVTGQATDTILTTAAASRMLIKDHYHNGAAAAGANSGIAIVGGDGIVIDGLRMDGNFAVGAIDIRTTATTDLEVRNAVCRTRSGTDIFLVDTITGSTGLIGPNISLRLNDHAANITEAITGATFVLFDPIYVVNLAGEKALLINWTASTDA